MKGFTLAEMLIALSIVMVAGVLLTGILVNNTGFFYKQTTLVQEGLSLNDAMGELTTNIKQAASVAAIYPEGDPSPSYTSSTTTLILKMPSLNDGGVIESTYDFLVITPDPINANILRQYFFKNSSSQRYIKKDVLTTNLDTVTFEFLDNSGAAVLPEASAAVNVELKVTAKTGSISSARTSKVLTKIRNN